MFDVGKENRGEEKKLKLSEESKNEEWSNYDGFDWKN